MSSDIEHLRESINTVDAIILVTGESGKVYFANENFLEIFSLSEKEIQKDFETKFVLYDVDNRKIDYDDYPFVKAYNKQVSIVDQQFKYVTSEKKTKWFSINSLVSKNRDNKIETVVSTFWNISDKMEIEEYIKETFENIESVFYSTNADGSKVNYISNTVKEMFGYSPEDIYDKKYSLLKSISKDDFTLFRQFIKDLRNGNKSVVEYEITDESGRKRTLRHSGYPIIMNNNIERIVGVIQDITREKKILEELSMSEEKFNILSEASEALIFTLNKQGHFVQVNRNGASELGYDPDEMTGKHFFDFIEESGKVDLSGVFENILSKNEIITFETELIDKDGNFVIFEINARSIKEKGIVTGMLSIGSSIAQKKKEEEQIVELNAKLVEANRIISIERERAKQQITVLEEVNKLKSEFVSNVSHELRTPLASIVGFAETISSDTDLPPEMVQEFSSIILTEGKRLAKLINDILDFSKLEVGEEELVKTDFDLIELLNGLVKSYGMQAADKGMTLTKQIPEAEIILCADKDRIANALGHLMANAIKFSNKGGRITVIVQDFLKEVEIIINDTGIGISEKAVPNLFQKFSKVDRPGAQIPGAGFGLVTVKKVIDLHKGIIQVKSEVNKGSSFIVRLPKK